MNAITKTEPGELPPLMQSEQSAMMDMVQRIAMDPTIDLDRLDRIIAMRKTMEQDAQRRAFNAAMAACKAELPQVVKNAENADNKAKYATLDKIGEAIDGVIANHGFSLSFTPGECATPGFLRIECIAAHSEGHERTYHADLPTDSAGIKGSTNKTPIHAWGSTMTYGRRYLTMMIFDVKSKIATPDDDGRAASAKATISEEEASELISLAAEFDADLPRLLHYYKIESVLDLPRAKLPEAIRGIRSVAK